MAAQIIHFPNAASKGNIDYVRLLRELQQLARVADREVDALKEMLFRDVRAKSIDAIRAAGIPFPDITDGL